MSDRERRRSRIPDRVAYMEEADDDGNALEDGPKVAASVAPSSPRKEKPNTRKSRRTPQSPLALSDDSSSVSSEGTGAELVPRRPEPSSSRRPDPSKAQKRVSYTDTHTTRPPAPRHTKTTPITHTARRMSHREEPTYYGRVEYNHDSGPIITPGVTRPRSRTSINPNHRHSSYHVPSRPPLANQKYQHQMPPAIMTGGLPPPSYPPPQWAMSAGPPSMHMPPGPPPPLGPPPPAQDYFPNSHSLSSRFDRGMERPMSALAHRPKRYPDEYEQENRPMAVTRRPSVKASKKRDEEHDRIRMPPPAAPQRPSSAMPLTIRTSPFAPPPPRGRTPVYDDHNPYQGEEASYDLSPVAYEYEMPPPVPRARRPSVNQSISYDQAGYKTEVAPRRNSQYGPNFTSSQAVDDKLRRALAHQDPEPPIQQLTHDALRRASKSKNSRSSKSTHSTASHDESDFRQAATATTRTSVEDDVTIRVRGNATLKLGGGAELQCTDGAEINFTRAGDRGSDRSSYVDPDERDERRDGRRARGEPRPSSATPMSGTTSGTAAAPTSTARPRAMGTTRRLCRRRL
ncbi:hypothetical protein MAPG_11254 [Magnaporthiopsis poae ATCC 64411]|uniref:Uncharacterized protein n=1 Tax=Magnaporthiopsis poae (strain ATCC 64411 / 73-15) TaxID=644358 RepID=A0A0C4EES5_MAGP6|nr:hypothetical protein MAPG_11254 [Magnaporthiopsis poae ATCC 64411]